MSATAALDRQLAARWQLRETGVWMFLGTVVMLFAAFTSAYVVRKSAADWVPLHLPGLLWINSAVLVFSSLTLELARRPRRSRHGAARYLGATCGLGLIFLAGQLQAWRLLVSAGFYLDTNPASSFFYILTGLHGVHLMAAFAFLGYVFARTLRPGDFAWWPQLAGLTATVWHFLTAVWFYLLIVMTFA